MHLSRGGCRRARVIPAWLRGGRVGGLSSSPTCWRDRPSVLTISSFTAHGSPAPSFALRGRVHRERVLVHRVLQFLRTLHLHQPSVPYLRLGGEAGLDGGLRAGFSRAADHSMPIANISFPMGSVSRVCHGVLPGGLKELNSSSFGSNSELSAAFSCSFDLMPGSGRSPLCCGPHSGLRLCPGLERIS